MTQFKYQLDKSSKKFICPKCGKKRFVKYIDTETGYYAEYQFGRCDRQDNCGYLLYPSDLQIVNYDFKAIKPIKPTYICREIFKKSLAKYESNHFTTYLFSKYDKNQVDKVIDEYNIGTAALYNGGVVFWQTDTSGNIRTGKIMAYDVTSGKRKKTQANTPLINWVHTTLKIPNFNLKQCLFGLHLLNESTKKVAIVESEKTAIIMSIEFPKYTWMSTGSISGFKADYLEPLKNIEVVAFPDKGGYDKWRRIGDELNKKGYNITVSQLVEDDANEIGWDLVDVMSNHINNSLKSSDDG